MSVEPGVSTASPWRREVDLAPAVRTHAPAVGALAVLVLFLFRDVVFLGQVFFHRDVHLQWHVQALAFVRSVLAGSWPVWNPWVSFGQPLWANPNNQVLYPFTWLHLLMQPWTYYSCFVVAHFLFSAAGMYVLGLRLGLSRGGAFVAAAAWVVSGPFLSLVDLWNHLAASAWIPWMFVAADVALSSGRALAVLAWGATLAVTVLTGSPDTGLIAGLALALYSLRYVRWREPRSGANRRLVAAGAAALVFAAALSTAQWWPSLELLRRSPRVTDLTAPSQAFWSIHPIAILQAFLPAYPERLPLNWPAQLEYFEGREAYLRSLYLGLCSFGLVLAGIEGRRRRLWLFFAGVAAASAMFALGRHTPAYSIALAAIPPLRTLRFPAKAMVPMAFAWAAMAGIGFDAWRSGPGTRRSRVAVAAVLLLAALVSGGLALAAHTRAEEWGSAFLFLGDGPRTFTGVLAPTARGLALAAVFALAMSLLVLARSGSGPRAPSLAWAAALVLLVDLLAAHDRLNLTAAREVFTYRPPIVDVVRPRDAARIYVYDYFEAGKAEMYLGHHSRYLPRVRPEDWPVSWMGALALRTALFPTVAGAWGLETAFDRDSLRLYAAPLGLLTDSIRQVEGTPLHTRLLRVGAVEYVVALHRQGFGDLTPVATLPSPFVEPLLVFRVPDPLPRTYAVGAARRVGDVLTELRTLLDPSFDPTREIVLPAGSATMAAASFSGQSRIVDFRPDRVRLEAELGAPGYVVLVDAHDPGWRATVDGQPAEMLRANVAFRAVAVPAGRHVVEHRYRPRSVSGGLTVSAAALLAAAVGLAAGRHRRSRRAPETP